MELFAFADTATATAFAVCHAFGSAHGTQRTKNKNHAEIRINEIFQRQILPTTEHQHSPTNVLQVAWQAWFAFEIFHGFKISNG